MLRSVLARTARPSRLSFAYYSQRTMADHGKAALKTEQVIGDVLDDFTPSTDLHVSFKNNKKIDHGNVLHPVDVVDGPVSISWNADPKGLYTLVKTDPDAPTRKDAKWREWCHWIVGNIPGQEISHGETIYGYVGCGPPKDTGLHRYVYIVYKQHDKVDFSSWPHKTKTIADGRGGFKVRDFAKKFNLGDPIAVNFFQAEFDDSVPKLYATFTG